MTAARPDQLWSVQDVSEYLQVPVRTIYRWRTQGYGPPARRVGKYLRYRQEDVIAWLDTLTAPAA
jgi:excisionase family DNA binding protein